MVATKEARDAKERVETERVQVLMPVDTLAQVKGEAERRKLSMSGTIVDLVRAGLNGGIAPAPVVVGLPDGDVERIADALAVRIPRSTAREQGNEDDLRGLLARALEGLTVVSRQLEVVTAVGRDAERDAETETKKSKQRWGQR